ncbi:hypothetical protein [Ramlibacter pallidus]|uniref:hypothetical protein n=1 Tax=Ramlibacter pallidus TaxID=2780087 RepID=UPI001D0D1BC7|nr:hypothetical protein [Ramlibacter pallidus]
MPPPALLLAALRDAPRRYRMPPLPADLRTAAAADPETALAFAIEAARTGGAPGAQDLFTTSLAALVAEALAPGAGDAAFQALVLRAQDADVDEHVRLSAQHVADRRSVRTALDTVAHPGKLRLLPQGRLRDELAALHALAAGGGWTDLHARGAALLGQDDLSVPLRAVLDDLIGGAALRRLARAETLRTRAAVRQYQALCERRGPAAGSEAAAAQGRAAARTGDAAEQDTLRTLRAVARCLQERDAAGGTFRAAAGLRTPRGFPGEAGKAKDEWDVAILREGSPGAGADIVLLAEVKAAPAAATSDLARLLRGLQRLAQADAAGSYAFPAADGELRIAGGTLRELQPHGLALPPHVIYCSAAPPEGQVQMLSAASKAVLLSEPASLAFAHALTRGETPGPALLLPVWEALPQAPQLRSALHQYDTARAAREAMLHPQDLLLAVEAAAAALLQESSTACG